MNHFFYSGRQLDLPCIHTWSRHCWVWFVGPVQCQSLNSCTPLQKEWNIDEFQEHLKTQISLSHITQYTVLFTIKSPIAQQFRWSKAWNSAHLYTLICFHIHFLYYLHPAQVGQHSPGKGEIIWLGGQVAVRGHTLWWQFKRPLCQDKTWFTVSLDKCQIKLTPTLHKTTKTSLKGKEDLAQW